MLKNVSRVKVKKNLPLFLIIYIPPIMLLLILGGIAGFTDIEVGDFLADPAQIVGYDSYLGLVNNLGVVLWAAAMAVCFFTFIALRRTGNNEDISRFVLFSGLLTLILLLDDLFLIHEGIGNYATEYIVPIIVIIFYILIIFRFRNAILKTNYIFLVIATGLFALSLAFDVVQSIDSALFQGGMRVLLEEGSKFLGIVSWLAYFTRLCLMSLRSTAST